MVKVRVLRKCFVGNVIRHPGDEFDHRGPINETVMVPLESLKPTKIPKQTKAPRVKPKKPDDES
jgi:hypothetical protein